jgi:hypothetical protein
MTMHPRSGAGLASLLPLLPLVPVAAPLALLALGAYALSGQGRRGVLTAEEGQRRPWPESA